MSEEAKAAEAEAEEARRDGAADATDWRAKYEAMRQHSREWERKAKENQGAADELEKLRDAQATEQEKAVRRAEAAEAELSELKAAAARAEAVQAAAKAAHVPVEAVAMLNGADADELAEQAALLLKVLPAYPTRQDDGGGRAAAAPKTNGEVFAEFAEGFFK